MTWTSNTSNHTPRIKFLRVNGWIIVYTDNISKLHPKRRMRLLSHLGISYSMSVKIDQTSPSAQRVPNIWLIRLQLDTSMFDYVYVHKTVYRLRPPVNPRLNYVTPRPKYYTDPPGVRSIHTHYMHHTYYTDDTVYMWYTPYTYLFQWLLGGGILIWLGSMAIRLGSITVRLGSIQVRVGRVRIRPGSICHELGGLVIRPGSMISWTGCIRIRPVIMILKLRAHSKHILYFT